MKIIGGLYSIVEAKESVMLWLSGEENNASQLPY